ncbi:hypothetical protein ACQUSR_29840 [Streptomyces sp. P1-3]|uniref:hypothetical protein n=1 Tax=Streptomyces sp. P1-3 TaxID=3421658 RepID=UPI003D362F9A
MTTFTRYSTSRLFRAQDDTAPGWLGFLAAPSSGKLPDTIPLKDAYAVQDSSFLFATSVPKHLGDLDGFILKLDSVIATLPGERHLVWLRRPDDISGQTVSAMAVDQQGTKVVGGLTAPLIQADNLDQVLALSVENNVTLALDGGRLGLTAQSGNKVLSLTGSSGPSGAALPVTAAVLSLAGPLRGCFVFAIALQRTYLHDGFSWGFQIVTPSHTEPVSEAVQWLPLAAADQGAGDYLPFTARIDPGDSLNAFAADRTAFFFAEGASETRLASYFRTTTGKKVTLVPVTSAAETNAHPARLVFTRGIVAGGGRRFQAAPAGDFTLDVDGANGAGERELLCALDGTEHIGFRPRGTGYEGDRLRFVAGMPAYVPVFPLKSASPVGPPVDPTRLLDSRYLTSWVSAVSAPGAASAAGAMSYVAQPRGASLYGKDPVIAPHHPGLLGPVDPAITLEDGAAAFPLVPYAGVTIGTGAGAMTAAHLVEVEHTVLAPRRRAAIATGTRGTAPSKAVAAKEAAVAADERPRTATTPAGVVVTLKPDGGWAGIALGQNTLSEGPAGKLSLGFRAPGDKLRQAFQTNGLFLVAANADHLGPATAGDGGGEAPAFHNKINVESWVLEAKVGANAPGDYSNVFIVKARKGKLVDLVTTPEAWTQAEDFAWPAIDGRPDGRQLAALSAWLRSYIEDAARHTGDDADYFRAFNALARDENWTGILVLRAEIAKLPAELAGIRAGVTRPDLFRAHHIGVEMSHLKLTETGPVIDNRSSIFGLIHYADPELTGSPPIPPAPGVDYAFRVLTLKALFARTGVQRFSSTVQLTVNQLFGMPVKEMTGSGGNPYNTLVLSGAFQATGGKPDYSLTTEADTIFRFANDILRRIEVTGVRMATRATGQEPVSAFGFTGFLDFGVPRATRDGRAMPVDLFSYGGPADGDGAATRQGLSFSGLDLVMSAKSGGSPAFSLETGGIRFDPARSTLRKDSLTQQFALSLKGLEHGDGKRSPAATGFLPVVTDVSTRGLDKQPWYGLRLGVDLGSPGRLAGEVGLAATLLLAWAPSSTAASPELFVGLELPGTGGGTELLSLENVLKLSIGQLRLTLARDKKSFLLMLTQIALKFLGLLKIPPSGSTSFYLFGNPQAGGKPSGLGWYAQYAKESKKPTAEAEGSR